MTHNFINTTRETKILDNPNFNYLYNDLDVCVVDPIHLTYTGHLFRSLWWTPSARTVSWSDFQMKEQTPSERSLGLVRSYNHHKSPGYKPSLYGIMSLQHLFTYITYVALRYVWCCFVQLHDVRPGVLERLASVQTFHPFSCFILSCGLFFYHCEIWLTNGVYFQKYIYDHRSEDCLLSGFQGSRNPNPFRERSSCNVL